MSDTPRTDDKATGIIGFYSCATVPAEFAHQLERELTVANTRIAELEGEYLRIQRYGERQHEIAQEKMRELTSATAREAALREALASRCGCEVCMRSSEPCTADRSDAHHAMERIYAPVVPKAVADGLAVALEVGLAIANISGWYAWTEQTQREPKFWGLGTKALAKYKEATK